MESATAGQQRAQNVERVHPQQRGRAGHHGSAVDQRQSLFRREMYGAQPYRFQRFFRGKAPALHLRFAEAHQHARDVGGRHQVPARAHRSVARHHRRHTAIQQSGQRVHYDVAHRRSPGCESDDAQQGRGAHHVIGQRLPGAACQVAHQIVLQRIHLLRRERNPDVAAHSGVDAVDPLAPRQHLLQMSAALRDPGLRSTCDAHFGSFARHAHHIFNGQRIRPYHHSSCHHSTVNACLI